jgi:hypothetical protein
MTNLLPATVHSTYPPAVSTSLGEFTVASVESWSPGDDVVLLIRPEAARTDAGRADVRGIVERISFRGRFQVATVRATEDLTLDFEFDAETALPEPGQPLVLALDAAGLVPLKP